ncbi:hypothetical protein GCM10010435_22930 [Winogradskya consettensis]|uniref:Protein kinase domain-containing protein n=1 Tax=Winogradskya consettensis TaxID=113560 RepID=A0A919T399_9ACTN|nr:hypothetical protein Aco04nite_86140 [Actinoplanes consettensis]
MLGEGGMGAVYLAQDRWGQLVAIKIIRPEYAAQAEFRGRFRSEVTRARQVPPFCTAAVLDADPDHETPYLVVEYVDGPDLADVVAEQGPLTGGGLHSVAVGVATALVAIHGAGVIHRDLKPRNVLFALGSPKVIDFGIARAFESTSEHTRTDQMVGTLSYMAPERLDGAPISPAVDVFAWGVLIAFAATGRTPFAADSPTATAVRILTGRPDLGRLTGNLRHLVDRSLAKDPTARPTAQELLDALLRAGAGAPAPALQRDAALPRAAALPDNSALPRVSALPPGPVPPDPEPRRPRRGRRVAVATAVAAVIAAAVGVPLGLRSALHEGPTLAASAQPSPSPSDPGVDLFAKPSDWKAVKAKKYSCSLGDDGLKVVSDYNFDGVTCPGPAAVARDQTITVDVREMSTDAAAMIWFHRVGKAGYRVEVDRDGVWLLIANLDGSGASIGGAEYTVKPSAGYRVTIEIADDVATVRIDGTKVYASVVGAPGLEKGTVALGLAARSDTAPADHVLYSHAEVRGS